MTRDHQPEMPGSLPANELVQLQQTLYSSKNPTRRWLHVTRKMWVEGEIQRAGPGERALEVGPGSGVYLPTLSANFTQVTATDIEEAHLSDLGQRFPDVELVEDDITTSRLEPFSFDLVLCSEVVEHIPDSPAAILGMFRLLKPGGTLILSTPQRFSPLELASKVAFLPGVVSLVRWVYREPVLKQGHLNLMTSREVKKQMADAGFNISREHFTGMYVPFLAEFGGSPGLALARKLEGMVRGGPIQWLLWTQYYVAEKPIG